MEKKEMNEETMSQVTGGIVKPQLTGEKASKMMDNVNNAMKVVAAVGGATVLSAMADPTIIGKQKDEVLLKPLQKNDFELFSE